MFGKRHEADARIGGPPDRAEWEALLNHVRPGNRFLAPAWFKGWESAHCNAGNWQGPARYVTVRLDGQLAGVLPFATQRVSVFRFLSAGGWHLPFRAFPVREDAGDRVLDLMLQRIRRVRGIVGFRVGPLGKKSPTFALVNRSLARNRWTVLEIHRGENLWLSLPRTLDAYTPMIRGRAKKADYFLRRLRKQGDVSLEVRTNLDPPEWRDTLRKLEKIESESWVVARGQPRFMGERNRSFWSIVLGDPTMSRAVRVWILNLAGDPVSFCLVIDAGPARYQIINGYSESVKRHSTGPILFKQMIHDAIGSGVERVCFGMGDPGHKAEWGATPAENLIDLVALKPGLRGKAMSAAYLTAKRVASRTWRTAGSDPASASERHRPRSG